MQRGGPSRHGADDREFLVDVSAVHIDSTCLKFRSCPCWTTKRRSKAGCRVARRERLNGTSSLDRDQDDGSFDHEKNAQRHTL